MCKSWQKKKIFARRKKGTKTKRNGNKILKIREEMEQSRNRNVAETKIKDFKIFFKCH